MSTSLIPAFSEPVEELRVLAHRRLPGGTLVEGEGADAIEHTRQLLAEGQTLLYGAAFAFDGLLALVDILVHKRGKWYGFLVRPSTRIKEWHLVDASIHEQALRRSGIELSEICVLLLNMQYVRRGELDPEELFTESWVMRRLRTVQDQVRGRMQMLRRTSAKKKQRQDDGFQLVQPDPEAVQAAVTEPGELIVDREALRGFLQTLQEPICFMDFEAYQTALPEWDGHWPFRQIPFQYSLHCLSESGGALHHEGFIAPPGQEPIAAFGASLLNAVGSKGTVLVYNLDSEQLILNQLEGDHPEWTEALTALRGRLVDLMTPFSQKMVQIPAIGNKLSLKFILPHLVPQMSYASLLIGSGDDANRAYNAMRKSDDPEFTRRVHEALLAYCEVDTLAMVKILERLRELAG